MSAYRTASPPPVTPPPSWIAPWLCRVLGHRWRIVRIHVSRNEALFHLHHMAGCDAFCARCRAHWLDSDPSPDLPGYPAKCRACGRYEDEPCSA